MVLYTIYGVDHAFEDASVVDIIDFESGLNTAALEAIVQSIAVAAKAINIFIEKIQFGAIKRVDVAIEYGGGEIIVDANRGIMLGF
jgi:hypothetical protein